MSKPKHLIFSMAKLLLTNTLEGREGHILVVMQFTKTRLPMVLSDRLDDINLKTTIKSTLSGLIQCSLTTCCDIFSRNRLFTPSLTVTPR